MRVNADSGLLQAYVRRTVSIERDSYNLITDDREAVVHDKEILPRSQLDFEVPHRHATIVVVGGCAVSVAPVFKAFIVEDVNFNIVAAPAAP
jgi:hypothetical protein